MENEQSRENMEIKDERSSMFDKLKFFDWNMMKGRIIVGLLIFSSWVFVYAQRANFNVIIAQVVSITGPAENKFSWTQMQKSSALMSFYAGYWVLQIPGGALAEKYGSKRLMAISGVLSSLLCIATPVAIAKSPYLAITIRVVFGLCQGIFPACFLLIMVNWYPENCRSRAIGLIFPGTYLGTILAMSVPSTIASNPHNWPLSFYILGGFGLLWAICWLVFYTDNAQNNKWMSDKEKKFIGENIRRKPVTNLRNFPVKASFSSKPVISIIICHSVAALSLNYIIALMPSIIADLYYIEVKDQKYFSFLAPIIVWIGGIVSCYIFDFILAKNIFPKINIRKFLNIFSLFPTGLFFIFATLIPPEKYIGGIVLFFIACFFAGFEVAVSMPNVGDICPQYSGIVFGVMNTIATLTALASIQIAYSIVTDEHKPYQWQLVFGILVILQAFGFTVFTIFGQGTEQSWAVQKDEEEKPKVENVI